MLSLLNQYWKYNNVHEMCRFLLLKCWNVLFVYFNFRQLLSLQ